jgi:hypothetical protein
MVSLAFRSLENQVVASKMLVIKLVASIFLVASFVSVPATAAPLFAPVDTSFEGTRFRGIYIGQSRAEVEAALAINGFRCLTSAEYPYDDNRPDGVTTCPIVRSDFIVDNISKISLMVRVDFGQKLGLPYHAVAFVNDVASAITLDPDYFNAAGTTPYAFAEQIIANYSIIGGLTSYGSGWRGVTANDEIIFIHSYPVMNTETAILVVIAATEETTPTFD